MRILFLKANLLHDRLGRFARAAEGREGGSGPASLPSSSGISTAAEAEAYWRAHIRDRRMLLHVKTKTGIFAVTVGFSDTNTHMWTREAKAGETADAYDQPDRQKGPRVIELDRAKLMDRLFRTVAHPWRVYPADLRDRRIYLGSPPLPDGGSYVVIFEPKDDGSCSFVTAQPRTKAFTEQLDRNLRPALPFGRKILQKSETPPYGGASEYPVLHGVTGPNAGPASSEAPLLPPPSRAERPVVATEQVATFFAFYKAIPPGARWITVRPNGPGTEGHPLLIQPSGDGSMRVIGGAGGKLNYLKLTGVRSEADYKQEASSRASSRREEVKRQRERDKKDGLTASKGKAREVLKAQVGDAQAKFIHAVAGALGWTEKDMRFPEEAYQNATPAAVKKAAEQHGRELKRFHQRRTVSWQMSMPRVASRSSTLRNDSG